MVKKYKEINIFVEVKQMDCEYGRCEVCGKENTLVRTTFYYDIKCECCIPKHFITVKHCSTCVPKEPRETKIYLKTDALKELVSCKNLADEYKKISNTIYKIVKGEGPTIE